MLVITSGFFRIMLLTRQSRTNQQEVKAEEAYLREVDERVIIGMDDVNYTISDLKVISASSLIIYNKLHLKK